MLDELLKRLPRFQQNAFPRYRNQFQQLVDDGQRQQMQLPLDSSGVPATES